MIRHGNKYLTWVAIPFYALIYGLSLWRLSASADFESGEALGVLLVFGVGYSALAWIFTLRVPLSTVTVAAPRRESLWIMLYLVLFTLYLSSGAITEMRQLVADSRWQDVVILASKLLVMCVLPMVMMKCLRAASLGDCKPQWPKAHWRVFVLMLCVLALLQTVIGHGWKAMMADPPAITSLLIAFPLCWLWQSLEAGVTEEFLFRFLLQTRLSAWLKSETAAIVAMAILFALVHAPGYVLRGAYLQEGMSTAPDALTAMAYAIAVVSPIGLMFGVLWARTRNFWLLVLLHGWVDTFPALADFIQQWHL